MYAQWMTYLPTCSEMEHLTLVACGFNTIIFLLASFTGWAIADAINERL